MADGNRQRDTLPKWDGKRKAWMNGISLFCFFIKLRSGEFPKSLEERWFIPADVG